MAVRLALFNSAPKGKERPNPEGEPKQAPKPKPPPKPKPAPKSSLKPAPKSKPSSKPSPKQSSALTSKSSPTRASGTRRVPVFSRLTGTRGEPKSEPRAAVTKPRVPRTSSAPTAPRPPVLQRRSPGATLARWGVLAVAVVCMVGFAVALAKVTLVPSPASVHLIHTNLRPGASIRAYLDQPETRDTVKQIGGNILLGVPFGILLPMLFPRARGLLRVAVLTALVMVLVEATQGAIVEGRAFDIDDVILNTLGALIGYMLLGRRLGRALHPRREHWWHRFTRDSATRERLTQDRRPARKRP